MVLTDKSSGNNITTTQRIKQTNAKKGTSRKIFIIILVSIAIILASLLSPLFNITEIRVQGVQQISPEDIITASGIRKGVNIFRTSLSDAEDNISRLPYVDTVTVKRHFPAIININVQESEPVAYIPFIGSYICIDVSGKIVEVVSKLGDAHLPTIAGLKFNTFTIGQKIKVEDDQKLSLAMACIKELVQNGLLKQILEIDVNDINNVQLNIENRLRANLGDCSRISYRISFLKGVLGELGGEEKGTIDLTNEDKVTFKAGE